MNSSAVVISAGFILVMMRGDFAVDSRRFVGHKRGDGLVAVCLTSGCLRMPGGFSFQCFVFVACSLFVLVRAINSGVIDQNCSTMPEVMPRMLMYLVLNSPVPECPISIWSRGKSMYFFA